MKLSVIIVSYNVKYYIDQCLRSVLKAIDMVDVERKGNQVEIIVVDNHSTDGSVEYLEKRYPKNLCPMLKIVLMCAFCRRSRIERSSCFCFSADRDD